MIKYLYVIISVIMYYNWIFMSSLLGALQGIINALK